MPGEADLARRGVRLYPRRARDRLSAVRAAARAGRPCRIRGRPARRRHGPGRRDAAARHRRARRCGRAGADPAPCARMRDFRELVGRLVPPTARPAMIETAVRTRPLRRQRDVRRRLPRPYRAGVLQAREVDGALLHGRLFVGSRAFYRALARMPEAERAKFRMTAVSYVNELYGDEAAKRRARVNARFVNSAMMATLLGDVVSDGLEDGQRRQRRRRPIQFRRAGLRACRTRAPSSWCARRARAKGAPTSNILWTYGHDTIPRHLRDIVVTEYGVADLRGKTDRDVDRRDAGGRGFALPGRAAAQAKDAGKIEPALRDSGRMSRQHAGADRACARRRRATQGLLAPFPFGTDFTEVEQRLLPALQTLKAASSSPLRLAQLAARGLLR